ncbi:MAG: hypothetical protein HOE48_05925 [Candidatus Latescibacteria bacterium]|nr:hypothetical protein [Candidatus Latescibacterota bacterium]MBT4137433.1 hypothetical protein [Candidatus Latescibacterota bacterium]MBT5831798.1 hypothetical protein [Candidatus Latescibacterota bacterium]
MPLFRLLQPVSTVAYAYPGSPPGLVHRTAFEHHKVADLLRGKQTLLKGRFLGGGIGYVCADDLAIYATAFRKPLKELNYLQKTVFDILDGTGPLTPRQIKEESQMFDGEGLLNKEIMPALHRLQTAFLVFEDQQDTDWERGWNTFSAEWPDVDLEDMDWTEAAMEVLRRFFQANVFATLENVKDWSGLALKSLKLVIAELEQSGDLVPFEDADLGAGWLFADVVDLKTQDVPKMTLMLHKADPLVQAHASELKRQFAGEEVLQYLLIDGEFKGAVLGHWRIGPHDVDNVVVELPVKERSARKAEILDAVSWRYQGENHQILAYHGKKI